MIRLATPLFAMAVAMLAYAPTPGSACDQSKGATAATVAAAAARCPALQSTGCPALRSTAVTAIERGSCRAHETSAVTASTHGTCGGAHGTSAVAASAKGDASGSGFGSCGAVMPGGGHAACAHGSATSSSHASCSTQGAAAAAGNAGGSAGCSVMTAGLVPGKGAHGGCMSCADMANCEAELESVGASTQVVALKNGVMFVYTATGSSQIHTVQAALARRTDQLAALVAAGDKAQLCDQCREMRGELASGRLTREVINIEGGCLTLMTSNDPTVVTRLHAMAGVPDGARKS